MAERIVDILESVEINELDGKKISVSPARGKGGRQPLLKHAPVSNRGERVRSRQFIEAAGGPQRFPHIGHNEAAD
jgi:hypothetical protein